MQKRYNCFDFIKIIFLLAVIMTHIFYTSKWALWRLADIPVFNFLKASTEFSCNAVEGFFIISGFLLVAAFKNIDVKTFVLKKYFRLAPVAIFSLICAIILRLFHLVKFRVIADLLAIFMLNNFGICWAKSSNQILWYSSALFGGLIIYFSIIKFLPKYKKTIALALVIISYTLLEILKNGDYSLPYKNYYNVFNVGFLRALGGIGTGCILAWIQQYNIKTNYLFNSAMEILLFCGTIYWLFCPHIKITNFVFVLICTALLWLLVQNNGVLSNLINRFDYSNLSKYVYSIYVTHYLVGFAICGGFYKSHLQLLSNYPIISSFVYIIISVVIGVITYHFIEEPVYKYARNRIID